jgi:hypothetical protein
MHEELQAAIIALLAAGLPEAVYGAVPQGAAYPYVVAGEPEGITQDTDTSVGELVHLRVRLFRKAGEVARANEFKDRVRSVLHRTEALSISKGSVVTVYVEGDSVEEPADDGKARETVVTVAILVDDITTGTD